MKNERMKIGCYYWRFAALLKTIKNNCAIAVLLYICVLLSDDYSN